MTTLTAETAYPEALRAIHEGSAKRLATVLKDFPLEDDRAALLLETLSQGGRPSCTHVLLQDGCSDDSKKLALKIKGYLCATEPAQAPGSTDMGTALATAMIVDSGTGDVEIEAQARKMVYAMAGLEPQAPRHEAPAPFPTGRPAAIVLERLLPKLGTTTATLEKHILTEKYPLYAELAARIAPDSSLLLKPRDMVGVRHLLTRTHDKALAQASPLG